MESDQDVVNGLKVERYFSKEGVDPFDEVVWVRRTAEIKNQKGEWLFKQENVEVPEFWSETAGNIVASKYFRGKLGTPEREYSVKQLIGRVVETIGNWGVKGGYFDESNMSVFKAELKYILVNQIAAFNSPVWFSCGYEAHPQTSACFINSIEDSMESILDMAKTEGMIFKKGSGSGINFSPLRSSKEHLRTGGIASGPVSFMKGFDSFAGIIKSGGATRRAAKMAILNVDHPDIEEFIECKTKEEIKAQKLIAAGYDSSYNGEAYSSISYQNANNSVRVTDEFMNAALENKDWELKAVTTGEVLDTVNARELLMKTAEAAHFTGDPGIQYDTAINDWHTSPQSGRINSSNPCLRKGQRILTSYGWKKIETLVGKDTKIFDGFGFVEGKVWSTGIKDIVRLHTNTGSSLDVTEDHKIYTHDGWKEAKDCEGTIAPRLFPNVILEGESQLPKCITGASDHYFSSFSIGLCETLGFLQGDGTIRKEVGNVSIYYTPEKDGKFVHETALPILSDIAAEDGNDEYAPSPLSENRSGYTFPGGRLSSWMINIGFDTNNLPYRKLPTFVWSLKNSSLCAFIRGLFSANGNVINTARSAVLLVSSCKEMLQEVQLLLQTVGIASAVRIHNKEQEIQWKNGNYVSKESYHLEITHNIDIYRFAKKIGFVQEKQTEKLATLISDTGKLAPTSHAENHRTRVKFIKVEHLNIQDEVFDFQVNSTHAGLVNGLIVHNCSEFMFLDDTACNLASMNLLKFKDGLHFKTDMFKHVVDVLILAQEILVGFSSYPTPKIEKNSHDYRPLGLGFMSLGALLMEYGLPYDSDEGRDLAASITSLMTGEAYLMSAKIAEIVGPFSGFEKNKTAVCDIIGKHWKYNSPLIKKDSLHEKIAVEADNSWLHSYSDALSNGVRNSQLSVLAPTGTISFMCDAPTTGVEPDIALVKYKKLAGAGDGILKLVNNSVEIALENLGYTGAERRDIFRHIAETDTIEGAPWLKEEHLPVFDCALKPANGTRSIHYTGHMKMCAAIQPFISGSISKSFNLPEDSTVEDIYNIYLESWKLGLKSVSVYRDNCKASQPLSTKRHDSEPAATESKSLTPIRRHLPDERPSITHKFSIGGHDGYMTVGLYEDGTPGEVFITIAKEGSTISGLLNSLGESTSIALQYGVPLKVLVNKHKHSRFEPAGFTNNADIRIAASIVDYIFRWLENKFITKKTELIVSPLVEVIQKQQAALDAVLEKEAAESETTFGTKKSMDSPVCSFCGGMTTRNGTCYKCTNCGSTTGCS